MSWISLRPFVDGSLLLNSGSLLRNAFQSLFSTILGIRQELGDSTGKHVPVVMAVRDSIACNGSRQCRVCISSRQCRVCISYLRVDTHLATINFLTFTIT
jgi:hypothetical protein